MWENFFYHVDRGEGCLVGGSIWCRSDRPKNLREFINPAPSVLAQLVERPCLDAPQHFSICPLYFLVAPGVSNGGKADLGANILTISVMILFGTPKQQTIPVRNLTSASIVTFLPGSTSVHLVNLLMARTKNSKPPVARGRGSTMSSPQTENG